MSDVPHVDPIGANLASSDSSRSPNAERQNWKTHQKLMGVISIFGLVGLIYWPALHGTWLWDDGYEVAANPLLQDRTGLAKIWLGRDVLDYFPLKSTVQWILWQVWGANPTDWHALNIMLHGLNAILLWRLLHRLGLRHAWLGGLLFAVHPLAVESVAWVAELKNLLSLALAVPAFLAYLDYDERGRAADLWRAVLLFLAALLCKSTVVMLPCVLALFLWWRHGARARQRLGSLVPFFVVALVLGLVTVWFQYHRAIAAAEIPVGGPATRVARAGLALLFYAGKAIWPIDLMPVYPRWPVDPPAARQFLAWPLLGISFGWLWLKRNDTGRGVLFGAGTFVLSLVPVLGFLAMAYMHASWVADHFAYVALPAVAGLFAGGVSAIRSRLTGPLENLATGAAAGLLVVLATLSWSHARNFQSPAALWSHAVKHNPDSPVVHNNLGIEFARVRDLPGARAQFEAALRIDPKMAPAEKNLRAVEQEIADLPK